MPEGDSIHRLAATLSDVLLGRTVRAFSARALGDAATRAPDRTLLADVLRWYQAPGDTWGYADEDLERTAEIALQHCRAAPGVVQSPTLQPDAWYVEPMVAQIANATRRAGEV